MKWQMNNNWPQMNEEDFRPCMFPYLQDNSNDFSVVDGSQKWLPVKLCPLMTFNIQKM